MKMEQCSETLAYKIQTPGNYLEERTAFIFGQILLEWSNEERWVAKGA